MSFQFLVCQLTCEFFFHKSQYVSISRMCVSIDVHFFFASFCVSKEKNLQKLCQTYTLGASNPPQKNQCSFKKQYNQLPKVLLFETKLTSTVWWEAYGPLGTRTKLSRRPNLMSIQTPRECTLQVL
jgi:hypothetical protein